MARKEKKQSFRVTEGIYHFDDVYTLLHDIDDDDIIVKKGKEKKEYYNISCAFDIETTSTFFEKQKCAFMYCWTFGINGRVIFGRTWEELLELCKRIKDILKLSKDRILIVYVHNLSFEFQFFRKIFEWVSVFSLAEREPVKALTAYGIEFRCSYKLSGYSLAKIGEDLQKYKVSKLVGDLDYTLVRHTKTPMTDKEVGYCVNDCLVVMAYIQEKIENEGGITSIPLTKTGYVRNYCRARCLPTGKENSKKYLDYRKLMEYLVVDTDEYAQLKRAYHGGFTHANAFYVGENIRNVTSYDFTSSYPAIICTEKFPMRRPSNVDIKNWPQFIHYLQNYCCLFDVVFYDLVAKRTEENPISYSKCWRIEQCAINNGRVISASVLGTTLTEQDFKVIYNYYSFSRLEISNFKAYARGYLPKAIIESVLELYKKKTTLKGVEGKEIEYMRGKEDLNSIYGMMVTDPCRDEIIYEDDWSSVALNVEDALKKYNESKKRFLYYPWGIWITAYAQRNLFTGIYELGDDYVYADTDSVKFLHAEKHTEYFDKYNAEIVEKTKKCLIARKIPIDLSCPKTKKGVEKPIGVWDFDGFFEHFKTLGAKRYIKIEDDCLTITVSGLNKKSTVPYLFARYGSAEKIFDAFSDGLYIPYQYNDFVNPTGKKTHTYIDYSLEGDVQDYTGMTAHFYAPTSCHISGSDYNLSLAHDFVNYLKGIRDKKVF